MSLFTAEQSEPSELCEGQFQHAMKVNGKLNRASACGLRPATSYQARVRAENSQGFSGYSSIGEAYLTISYIYIPPPPLSYLFCPSLAQNSYIAEQT